MLAAVFKHRGLLEIEQRPEPGIPADDEVLLQVEGCGVCGTDLHILSDPPGHPATEGVILGHEVVGRIVDKGAKVHEFDLGSRVVLDPQIKCGVCEFCRSGKINHCTHRNTIGIFIDGGFARFVKAPQKTLHPIGDGVPLNEAVWGELLACVLDTTEKIRIQPAETAVVIGAGPAGVLHAMLLKAAGADVFLADISNDRLNRAKRAGIAKTVNAKETNLSRYITEVTSGIGVDVAVDAVGNQFTQCLDVVTKGGTIALFGVNTEAHPVIPQSELTFKEVKVIGCFLGRNTFSRATAILESRILNLAELISHEIGVAELPEGLQAAREGKAMKILVLPEK
jgi:(R,R)-butanediol dehydrogenase/meso-butanediol dehydrogenase/diacetyl reductase